MRKRTHEGILYRDRHRHYCLREPNVPEYQCLTCTSGCPLEIWLKGAIRSTFMNCRSDMREQAILTIIWRCPLNLLILTISRLSLKLIGHGILGGCIFETGVLMKGKDLDRSIVSAEGVPSPYISIAENEVSTGELDQPDVPISERLRIYCCFEERNKAYWEELRTHLAVFKRLGYIITACNYDIPAGSFRDRVLEKDLNNADIILLLISAYFIDSDFCWETAMRALQRATDASRSVIPILVTPVLIEGLPLEQLQVLPDREKPISRWSNRHQAYKRVAKGIQDVIRHYQEGGVKWG